MKQKLFENVGGNQFKLITESIDEINPNAKFVREGLKKVFSSGGKTLSYKRLQGVGLGYIKHVEEAKKTAIQEARTLAKEYGYRDNEDAQAFVKENEFSNLDAQDPTSSLAKRSPEETSMSNPEEAREVQIGKEIIKSLDVDDLHKVADLARELIQMHQR
jgi:hypothetical protein